MWMNIITYISAYTLTHFTNPREIGLGIPRPTNSRLPTDIGLEYQKTQRISIN